MGLFKKKTKEVENTSLAANSEALNGMDKKTKKLYNKYKLNPVDVDFFIDGVDKYTIDGRQVVMCCINLKSNKKVSAALVDAINNDYYAYYDPSTLVNDEVFVAWTEDLASQPLPDVSCEPLLLDVSLLGDNNLSLVDLKSPMSFVDFANIDSVDSLISEFNLSEYMSIDSTGSSDDDYEDDGFESDDYEDNGVGAADDYEDDGFESDDYDEPADDDYDEPATDDYEDEYPEEDAYEESADAGYDDVDYDAEMAPEDVDYEAELQAEYEDKDISFSGEEADIDYSLSDTQQDIYDLIGAHVSVLDMDSIREKIVSKLTPLIQSATNPLPIERFTADSEEFESLTKMLNVRVNMANDSLRSKGVRLASELNTRAVASVNDLIGHVLSMPEFVVDSSIDSVDKRYVYMYKLRQIDNEKVDALSQVDEIVNQKEARLIEEYDADKQVWIDGAVSEAAKEYDRLHKHVLESKIKNLKLSEENAIETKALSQIDDITRERNAGVERLIEVGIDAVIESLELDKARFLQDELRKEFVDELVKLQEKERENELDAINKRHSHENFESMNASHSAEIEQLNGEIDRLKNAIDVEKIERDKFEQIKLDTQKSEYETKLADLNRQFTNAKLSWESERQSLSTSMQMASDKAQQAEDKASIFTDNAKRFVFTVASCAAVVGMLVGFVISTIVH